MALTRAPCDSGMGKCQILLLSNAKSLVRYLREMLLKFSTVENNFISLIYLIIYLFCVCMWSRGERPLDILKAVWATAKLQHCTFFFSSTPLLDFPTVSKHLSLLCAFLLCVSAWKEKGTFANVSLQFAHKCLQYCRFLFLEFYKKVLQQQMVLILLYQRWSWVSRKIAFSF